MPSPRLVRSAPRGLPDRTDDELMTLVQTGVRDAFEALVSRHAERLAHACSRLVNDPAQGAELAQETWVTVWRSTSQYRGDGRFIVWLLTLARNRCRNHLRNQGAMREGALHAAREPAEAPSPDQIDRLLDEERRRRVRECLARLPPRMRDALLLRYAEELRYDEMAAVLNAGESTLRSRVHHGLRLLKALLEKKQ